MANMFGMAVRGSKGGEYRLRQRSMVLTVAKTVQDPEFGGGVFGFDISYGKPVLVFSNPVPTESRKNLKRSNTMSDWIKGLNVGGRIFTIGAGSVVEVSDLTGRRSQGPRTIEYNGKQYSADVIFCQWISSWKSVEQIRDGTDKNVLFAYAIARSRLGENDVEKVVLDCFFPKSRWNRFNKAYGGEYPVIFSFNDLGALERHIDDEARKFKKPFSSYLVRMIDRKSGKIAGSGMIVYCQDWQNPDVAPSSVFTRNFAAQLHLTRKGLADFVKSDGFDLEVYGLFRLNPSVCADEGKTAAAQRILENPHYIPRDEAEDEAGRKGLQKAILAVPSAIRGKTGEGDDAPFWVDKIVITGHTDYSLDGKYGDKSDIIPADAYSGQGLDSYGNPTERGLERTAIVFKSEDGGEVQATDLFSLARYMGCERVEFPDGRWNAEYFEDNWNRPAEPGQAPRREAPPQAEAAMEAPQRQPKPSEAGFEDEEFGPPFDEVPF